jgi:hypothetical protein
MTHVMQLRTANLSRDVHRMHHDDTISDKQVVS